MRQIFTGENMKKYFIFFLLLIITSFSVRCSDVNAPEQREFLLKYEITNGWTHYKSSVIIYDDLSAISNVNEIDSSFEFTPVEKKELKTLLSRFSSFERIYQPENGAWCDISAHELIYYRTSGPDSVSIYEPLDSENIPTDLASLVNLLMIKL